MNMKKKLAKNTIEYFKNKSARIPSALIPSTKEEQFKAYDRERQLLKDLLNNVSEDGSQSAKNFFNELNRTKALSYVNEIQESPLQKVNEVRNVAEEINKKYNIKKVEATKRTKRVGLIGYKVGMMTIWDKWGIAHPLSVIKIDNCQVTQVKSEETDKYFAIQVGVGSKEPQNATKPMIGHFIKNDLPIKRHLKEFRVTAENLLPVGYALTVRHFVPGQLVDVKGISKGKGWQGVMTRWNFSGGFKTHGCSLKHRAAVKYLNFYLILLGFYW
jgi:50S ribosomal protein uL3